ncbi:MAG: hypothetical protein K2I70_02290, partial [Bacilli bacterium]|nr:hypothetical protein [Bacilli bacterium]
YRNYLADNISDVKIESKLEEYFQTLESIEKKRLANTKDSLQKVTESIIRLSNKKSIQELESIFQTLINENLRRENASLYADINSIGSKQIESYISSCFLYSPKISSVVHDVKTSTNRILNTHGENLVVEYQETLKPYLERYKEHVLESIRHQLKGVERTKENVEDKDRGQDIINAREVQEKHFVTSNEMQFVIPTVKKFGIIIEETFDGFTVKSAENPKPMMLYKGDNGLYFTEDHSIEIADLGSNSMRVNIGDKVITETMDTCYLGTKNNPRKIEMKLDFLEYKVSYAGVEQTDMIKTGMVINEIASSFPGYYAYLSNETMFLSLKEKVMEARKEAEELYKDEYGKVRINPNTREKFMDKVYAIGFKIEEREDGVYAIDRHGVNHKIQYNSGYAYFEDNPHVGFNTSAYFITDNAIIGPQIDYRVNKDTLSCSADYLYLTISGSGKVCRLGFDSNDKFVCEIDTGEKVIRNSDTIKKIVKNTCPEMYEKIAHACLEHQNNLQKGETEKEENREIVNNDIAGSGDATEELLEELENPEVVNIGSEEGIKEDINIGEEIPEGLSIDDEIFALEQDPNVQRYIELMKLQAERNSTIQPPGMGI